jgi:putative LysE/RhtB family amino acid efflux pump
VGPMPAVIPAWLAGFVCGFVASVGVGPVNLTVIEQGMQGGFRRGFLAGIGAIFAETIYALLAFYGNAALVPQNPHLLLILQVASAVIVLGLAVRYLFVRPTEERLQAMAEKTHRRWHDHRAWILGFLVTASNLALILLWATLATTLYAHGWVRPTASSRIITASGVFLGGLLWYLLVTTFVSRAHRRVPLRALVGLQRACGVILLVFSGILIYRILQGLGTAMK